ncbi:2-dehydropantoate 2-reductase [Rhizobium sp. L1K21]|uniref:2-dehydropantoate 2-reductase n=1 Tax=Rhizobium sp. L1K21 TaxID=2954933 RepID=UPI002093D8F7|nr:2-dehydropantoate 2-reductase [Rhizobium sp. L1K21]MCO6185438.1 2-dehydropantoate 2-reductase [Rhizobium sp. L1K21]
MARAVIFGAGAIGCFNGLSWLSENLDIAFLGRPNTGTELKEHGGTITGPFGNRHISAEKITYGTTPDILRESEIIFLAVKATGNETAADEIRANAKPGSLIVALQNGVGNAERLRAWLPGFDVVEGMTPFNVIKTGPAQWKKTMNGKVILADHPKLKHFLEPLSRTEFDVRFHGNMRAVLWSKLLLNLNNALNALSGETIHAEFSNRQWRKILVAAQREAFAVMDAEGIEPVQFTPLPPRSLPAFLSTPNVIFNTLGLRMLGVTRDARSSMSSDFAANRKTEIDYLNGAVVDVASRHNIACPVNTAIVRMVKEAEAGGRRTWSAKEMSAVIRSGKF